LVSLKWQFFFAEETHFFQFFSSIKEISQNNENSWNKEITESSVHTSLKKPKKKFNFFFKKISQNNENFTKQRNC